MRLKDLALLALLVVCALLFGFCAESESVDEDDSDASADTDSDADTDADSDADTDSDADADTDTDTDTDTDPDGGADTDTDTDTDTEMGTICSNPIVVPDSPAEFNFTDTWSNFGVDSFNNSQAGCYAGAGGGTIWFEANIPIGENISVEAATQGNPTFAVNYISACGDTSCLGSGKDFSMYPNTSGSIETVLIAVEQEFPLAAGVVDLAIDRFELHGDVCIDGILMDSATTTTPETEVVYLNNYSAGTMPSGCSAPGTGQDVWFDVEVPAYTQMVFTPACSASGTCYYGYAADCTTGCSSPGYWTVTSAPNYTYTNSTGSAEYVNMYIKHSTLQTTGTYTATVSLTDLPTGNACSDAISITTPTATWSDTNPLFTHSCPDCPGASGPDVWHEVTVGSDEVLNVQKTAGTEDIFIAVLSDCTSSPTVYDYVLPPEPQNLAWHNNTGSSQTVYVVAGAVNASDSISAINLSFAVQSLVAGDFCTNAHTITPTGSTANATGSWTAISDYYWADSSCLSVTGTGEEVWFEMDVPSGELLSVTENSSTTSAVHIMTSCAGTCEASAVDSATYLNVLSTTQTVWVAVEDDSSAAPSGNWDVDFTWSPPGVGNLCVSADTSIDLTTTTSDTFTGSWLSYTNTTDLSSANGCETAAGSDLWFEVTVPANTKLTVTDNNAGTGPALALHAVDSCGPSAICNFSGPDSVAWYNESTTATANVLIGVEIISSTVTSGAIDLSFDATPIPAGDACGSAAIVSAPFPVTGAIALTSYDPAWPYDPSCAVASGNDTWFQVTVQPGEAVFLEATPFGTNDIVIYFADSCPVSGCVASSDVVTTSGSEQVAWYNSGSSAQDVYAVIKAKDSFSNGANVAYVIDKATAVAGDFCAGAHQVDLTAASTLPVNWTGDLSSYSDGWTGNTGCSGFSTGSEVWFEVVVPADGWLNVSNSGTASTGIQVLAGCTTMNCEASGFDSVWWHNSSSSSPATVLVAVEGNAVSTGTLDLNFDVANIAFVEDFSDNSAGWALDTDWAIGAAVASSGCTLGDDPGFDHTGTTDEGLAGVVIGGCTPTTLHAPYCMTSPTMNTSSMSSVWLSFWRWLIADYDPFQHHTIEVYDGGSWQEIFNTGPSPALVDTAWTYVEYDISTHANAVMQIRWCYDVTSSGAYSSPSWSVDDVCVSPNPAACP